MNHFGYSQLQSGSSMDILIAGRMPPVPEGYRTYAAIYRLCGGLSAQQYFETRQQELFKKKLLVDLGNPPNYAMPKFRAMADAEQHWATKYSSEPRSWEFCRVTVSLKQSRQNTRQQSLPPIATESDDVTSSSNNNSEEEEFFSLNEDDAPEDKNPHYLSTGRNETSPVSSSPPPSSPLHILCRCGTDTDGHRTEVKEDAIECEGCHNYSHLACQTYRRTPHDLPKTFQCHMCKPRKLLQSEDMMVNRNHVTTWFSK